MGAGATNSCTPGPLRMGFEVAEGFGFLFQLGGPCPFRVYTRSSQHLPWADTPQREMLQVLAFLAFRAQLWDWAYSKALESLAV